MVLWTRFNQFVSQNLLAEKKDLILVAVSGGKDSILLLHLFLQAGFQVGVAHCNFNLRGDESDEEEQFIRAHCQKLAIPFFSRSFHPKEYAQQHHISVQMACRDLRYEWFHELASKYGYTKIATAHHANDQVETFILNLLRGTGAEGLKGIPVQRDLIIRPLLFLTRPEIETEVAMQQLEYRDDSSNFSTKYSRNKVRLEIVPRLKELNPQLESTFLHTMEILGEMSEFIKISVENWKELHFRYEKDSFQISLAELLLVAPRKLWVFEIFRSYGFSAAISRDIVSFLNRYEKMPDVTSGLRFESETHQLFYDRHFLYLKEISRSERDPASNAAITVTEQDSNRPILWRDYTFFIQQQRQKFENETMPWFEVDADQLQWPLQIRSWQTGDIFRPLGMSGKRKKLSDLFISNKVPAWRKSEIPVLVNGNGEIIWVVGLRGSETFKILEDTKNLIAISYFCEYGH